MPRSKFTQHVCLFCSCAWVKPKMFGLFYYKFIYFKRKTIFSPSLTCWILKCEAFRMLWRINNFNNWPENELRYIMIKSMYWESGRFFSNSFQYFFLDSGKHFGLIIFLCKNWFPCFYHKKWGILRGIVRFDYCFCNFSSCWGSNTNKAEIINSSIVWFYGLFVFFLVKSFDINL